MNDETTGDIPAFYRTCMSKPVVQALLLTSPSAPDLARMLKKVAYQELTYSSAPERYFLVALLDTMDWTLLAQRVLQYHLHPIQASDYQEALVSDFAFNGI